MYSTSLCLLNLCPCRAVLPNSNGLRRIYTTIGGLSTKVNTFLAVRPQFDSDHGVNFNAPTCCDLCATAFCVLMSLVFYEKIIINNVPFRTDVMFTLRDWWICVIDKLRCANDGAGSSHGRLIARWWHDRCFDSTRGPTGSLLVSPR